MSIVFGDIHAHSSLQPFGRSFREKNSKKAKKEESVWYTKKPGVLAKLFMKAGASPYTQSSFLCAAKGNVRAIGVALYSPEISFFDNKLGDGNFSEDLSALITRYSDDRIEEVINKGYNYYVDLFNQYRFMCDFNNSLSFDKKFKCTLPKNYNEAKAIIKEQAETLIYFFSIEGAHCFGCGYPPWKDLNNDEEEYVLSNVELVKNWDYKPLYITIAHHFYNQVAGHCKSLPEKINELTGNIKGQGGQDYGINTGITPLGAKIIKLALKDPNRILIDIKHMSTASRTQYYNYLETEMGGENIPIIFSHGGVNSRKDFSVSEEGAKHKELNAGDIGLFDFEIEKIIDSNGIIGLNIDQRVMSSETARKSAKELSKKTSLIKARRIWFKLIWNNIEYIVRLLDNSGREAWNNICMGTDFDGVINPIGGFYTEEDMPLIFNTLTWYIDEFIKIYSFKTEINKVSQASEIATKIMIGNLNNFLERNWT